jgi:EREBP-like factor
LNFPDDAAQLTSMCIDKLSQNKVIPKESTDSVLPNVNQHMGYLNMLNNDFFDSLSFPEEKPKTNQYGYAGAYCATGNVGVKPVSYTEGTTVYFSSDKGSDSFGCSDFGWADYCAKTPDTSSVLSEDAFPEKIAKLSSEDLLPGDNNTVNELPGDLSEFDSQRKLCQMPNLEGDWAASIEAILNGDAAEDGGCTIDLWALDHVATAMGDVI